MKKIKNLLKKHKLFVCGAIFGIVLALFLPAPLFALIFGTCVGIAARVLKEEEDAN